MKVYRGFKSHSLRHFFAPVAQWIEHRTTNPCAGGSTPLGRVFFMIITDTSYDIFFMSEAIKEAEKSLEKDEPPVGAVVVRNFEIISCGHNLRETLQDPTAHAELLAIKAAALSLQRWRLSDCVIYVTLEPCSMCAGAMVLARISRLVYGADDPKSGAVRSLMNLLDDKRLNHKVEVTTGVLAAECGALLRDFFSSRRK